MILLPLIHGKKSALSWTNFLFIDLTRIMRAFKGVADNPPKYRGTGNTIPFSCTDNDVDLNNILNGLILGNSSDVALGRLWTQGAINSELCFQKSNATGSFIGTAFVARDLISVVDALDGDGMLRYWGKQRLWDHNNTEMTGLTNHARALLWHDLGCDCTYTSRNAVLCFTCLGSLFAL
jgi:hypothetical protein